ncbi:hypothetical protein CSOJ01_15716 [Colletotrichum sojae]|uniref:Uncharacterized protein n=1 Tax=Colletotrichum sojae TaxID=2175907 RepID=A0A8H6IMF1_9PEZI|nr:hypothetical protein CSOJ01_15716 [Colletotrichum sojae]
MQGLSTFAQPGCSKRKRNRPAATLRLRSSSPSQVQEEVFRKRGGDDNIAKPPSKRAYPNDSDFQDSGRGQPAAQSKNDTVPGIPPRQGIIDIHDSDSDAEAPQGEAQAATPTAVTRQKAIEIADDSDAESLHGTTLEATSKIAARQEVIEISDDSDDEALQAESSQEDAQEALAQEDLQSEATEEFPERELEERAAKVIEKCEGRGGSELRARNDRGAGRCYAIRIKSNPKMGELFAFLHGSIQENMPPASMQGQQAIVSHPPTPGSHVRTDGAGDVPRRMKTPGRLTSKAKK